MTNISTDEIYLEIFERNIDTSIGDSIASITVELLTFDQNRLRKVYVSRDNRISLTTNEREDGKVLSAYISGTGLGIDRRKTFAFSARSCGQFDQ